MTKKRSRLQEMRSLEPGALKWKIEFDEEWVVHNGAMTALRTMGYEAAAFRHTNAETGESYVSYVIANMRASLRFPGSYDDLSDDSHIIFETQDQDELNRYINLILPPRS